MGTENPQGGVTVHEVSFTIDKQRPIRIAVESHAQIGTLLDHSLLQRFDVQRTTLAIDVSTIRITINRDHLCAESCEQSRSQGGARAVCTIDHDRQPFERQFIADLERKEIQILLPQYLFERRRNRAAICLRRRR